MIAWFKRSLANRHLRKHVKPSWARPGLTATEVRQQGAQLTAWLDRKHSVRGRGDRVPGGPRGEWFAPPVRRDARVLLYLHGGAWVMYTPALYRAFARRLAQRLHADVFLPDYRLAPEHRFPAAADDCLATYKHLLALGVTPSRIVLAGDSAGANLALVTLLRARDEGLPLPSCAVLFSAATDLTFSGESVQSNARRDAMFSPAARGFVLANYLQDPAQATHPWVSPLLADLHGLPPLLLQVGDTEMLLDDSRRLAARVREAGGMAELSVWRGVPHAFQVTPLLTESRRALDEVVTFVERHWAGPLAPPKPAPDARIVATIGPPTAATP